MRLDFIEGRVFFEKHKYSTKGPSSLFGLIAYKVSLFPSPSKSPVTEHNSWKPGWSFKISSSDCSSISSWLPTVASVSESESVVLELPDNLPWPLKNKSLKQPIRQQQLQL